MSVSLKSVKKNQFSGRKIVQYKVLDISVLYDGIKYSKFLITQSSFLLYLFW